MPEPEQVRVTRLYSNAQMPERAHASDAGWDVRSAQDAVVIEPGKRALISTGLAMALPQGWCCLVMARSGLAAKHGISVVNGPGLIDSGYRGEVKVILHNNGDQDFAISKGDRIAQFMFMPVPEVSLLAVESLDQTERKGGFGSTGVE